MKNTILQGHVLEQLKRIPADSVHCCVTSPPYWGLRDYGLEPVMWPDGWHGQLGLEPDLHMYVAHLIEIFREVRRVLHPSGTCFLNLGDSYIGSWGNYGARAGNQRSRIAERWHRSAYEDERDGWDGLPPTVSQPNLKPKDLAGIPWRVAFALQDDGWWLRSDIIWAKPNCLPESVRDRPTKAHEYVFLLTKSARYFWDQEAVRENGNPESESRYKYAFNGRNGLVLPDRQSQRIAVNGTRKFKSSRNCRTVWTINPQPFPHAHFATFPPGLVKRCVLAGSSPRGVCPTCGAPWERVVERERQFTRPIDDDPKYLFGFDNEHRTKKGLVGRSMITNSTTTGFHPTCACPASEPVPAIILDPFLGSGTTAAVAREMGRDWIGIELNPEYIEMAWRRIDAAQPALIPAGLEASSEPGQEVIQSAFEFEES